MRLREQGDGWIGIDLDGTLAYYDGFKGDEHVGEPIEPMVKQVRKWIREGRDVRLFTARKPHPAIRKWMREHLGALIPITAVKDPDCQAIFDDRAVGVKRNEGVPFSEENVEQIWERA